MKGFRHRIPGNSASEGQHYVPPVDVVETEDSVILTADMPGVADDSVEVLLVRDQLRISGKAVFAAPPEGFRPLAVEFTPRVATRTFQVHEHLDTEGAEASLINGVLSVRLQKKRPAEMTKIEVNAE